MARKRNTQKDTPSVWDRLPGWGRHLLCLTFLLAVAVGFFWPVQFGDGSIAGSDSVNWREQAQAKIEYRKKTGKNALWNPNVFAGTPDYNPPSQVLQINDALQSLRKYAWPTIYLFVLLVGTYLLVFFLTRSSLGGVVAACGYGLTTYLPVIISVGHNTKFIALCMAPWLALTFAYCLRRPKLLSALCFAAALAANLQAKHVQITYYVTFLLGVWWIVEAVSAVRKKQLALFGKGTAILALGSLLGVLMVTQPYLSNAQYKQYSTRGSGGPANEKSGLDTDYAMRWSQGAGELLTLAVAGAYGGGSREGTYWGPKPFTEGPHYLGIVVLLLAGLALWRLQRRAVWGLGIGAFFMTLFALGRHLSFLNEAMYAYVPLFDAFRAPETWMSVVAFALAVLAGMGGCYAVQRGDSEDEEHIINRSVYVTLGATAGFLLLLFAARGTLDFEKKNERQQAARQYVQRVLQQRPQLRSQKSRVRQVVRRRVGQYMQQIKQKRTSMFTGDLWRALLFFGIAAALLIAYRQRLAPAWAMQLGLALLVVFDLGGVGRRYLNGDDLKKRKGGYEASIPTYDFDTFLTNKSKQAGGAGHFRVLSLESRNPFTNARPSYQHESLGGYSGAKLQLYQDFIDHIYRNSQNGSPNENALDLLNTRYIVARRPLPGYKVAYRGEKSQWLVLKNTDAVPRAFFVGQTEVINKPEKTWKRLRSASFDPQKMALLPKPLEDFETTPVDSSSSATATLESFSPRKIVWNVKTDAPRLLVASEIYYPVGWKAYIDGKQAPIRRADYLLRAVPVPAGKHRLVMRYNPQSRVWGARLGWAATILTYGGILLLLGLSIWRRRTAHQEEADERA